MVLIYLFSCEIKTNDMNKNKKKKKKKKKSIIIQIMDINNFNIINMWSN